MSTILDRIKAYKLDEIEARKAARSLADVEEAARAADPPRGFAKALLGELFRQLRDAGVRQAYIGSAAEPYHANRLYESLAPARRQVQHRWRKILR